MDIASIFSSNDTPSGCIIAIELNNETDMDYDKAYHRLITFLNTHNLYNSYNFLKIDTEMFIAYIGLNGDKAYNDTDIVIEIGEAVFPLCPIYYLQLDYSFDKISSTNDLQEKYFTSSCILYYYLDETYTSHTSIGKVLFNKYHSIYGVFNLSTKEAYDLFQLAYPGNTANTIEEYNALIKEETKDVKSDGWNIILIPIIKDITFFCKKLF